MTRPTDAPSNSDVQVPQEHLILPESATDEEAAAIAAAIGAHLQDRAAAAAATADDGGRTEQPWTLVGRIEARGGTASHVPAVAPADAWTVAARQDRL